LKKVLITKVACETALGSGPQVLWQGLLDGRSGIAPLQRFSCENYISSLAACIDGLGAPVGGSRLDPLLERLAVQMGDVPRDARLLVASTKGEIDRFDAACRAAEPIPESVLFEPLVEKISHRFELIDPGMNINAACASSTIALARGAAMIAAGQVDSVLVYAADIVSEFVYSGFSALQALSGEACKPFAANRQGLNLGEAGVALLLTSEEHPLCRQYPPLAAIAGWGAANDAHHVTAPARDGSGLILACRAAMNKAGIGAEEIAAINAHGTATLFNDAMELTAFNSLFTAGLPPLHGVKGSLGHCLGAAGGIEALVAGYALKHQKIPGTVGCERPEEAGQGRVGVTEQKISGEYLLSTNSGFGGINAALVLQGVSQ
jgi:3-oxoacyl-[acyl-carrier-protein] synthase II